MNIYGLQKLTLLDYPEKLACSVFTGGCNFRCPFCHNTSLVLDFAGGERIETETVFEFLRKRKGVLDGICVTGGEPMLQGGLEEFLTEVKKIGYSVKLDTNGSFPERLRGIVRESLVDFVAMDIKNSPRKYAYTAGVPDLDLSEVSESVRFLLSGAVPYEFRTTVVGGIHVPQDFVEIGEWICGADKYFLQQFTDSDNVMTGGFYSYSPEEMKIFLEIIQKYVPSVKLRGI